MTTINIKAQLHLTKSDERVFKQFTYLSATFGGEVFFQSHQRIARFLEISVSTVRRAIKKLTSLGVLLVQQDIGQSNYYQIDYTKLEELLTLKSTNSISLLDLFKNSVINKANPILQTKFNRFGLKDDEILVRFITFKNTYDAWLNKIYSDDYMTAVNIALGTLGGFHA